MRHAGGNFAGAPCLLGKGNVRNGKLRNNRVRRTKLKSGKIAGWGHANRTHAHDEHRVGVRSAWPHTVGCGYLEKINNHSGEQAAVRIEVPREGRNPRITAATLIYLMASLTHGMIPL